MLVVETIARIRREHFVKGKTIREIARDLKVSRNTVRKVVLRVPLRAKHRIFCKNIAVIIKTTSENFLLMQHLQLGHAHGSRSQ
jgi:DNA-binding transcriptional regulator LsrR (DeoR family)